MNIGVIFNVCAVGSQSEISESSEEEECEEEESEGEGGREETDTPHFIPFPNRSNVTSEILCFCTPHFGCMYVGIQLTSSKR